MKPYYEADGITIYHGDVHELAPAFVDVTFVAADPMYGNQSNIRGESSRRGFREFKGCSLVSKDWRLAASDDIPFDPTPWLSYPEVILWGANHYGSRLPDASCWVVWDKRVGGKSDDNADCELAWTNLAGPSRLYSHLWRGWIRAGEENIAVSGPKLHPFQKPLALMRFCLSLSRTSGTVLEPYMGSGPMLAVCREIGRKAIGVDTEEWCCEVAAKRLAQGVLDFGGAA